MEDSTDKPSEPGTPFGRFKELARKVVSVPKKQAGRKEMAQQRKRAAKRREK